MTNKPDYFVVCVDYGKLGREANVDPNMLWSDVLDAVGEAAGDGHPICFVHHIHDGVVEDRTQEALDAALNFISDHGDPLPWRMHSWVEETFGMDVARHFRCAA